MPTPDRAGFDPRAILRGLQAGGVQYAIIGGLARVLRGNDEVTYGVDICPNLLPANLTRLQTAIEQLVGAELDEHPIDLSRDHLRATPVIEVATPGGELKVVPFPAGVPRGYDALRSGSSTEHLGGGVRAEVAGTIDLIAMASALGRDEDLARLPILRRILELEVSPTQPGFASRNSDYRSRNRAAAGRQPSPGPER